MSSDDDFALNQEPKKMFCSFLIYNIKEIEWQLFFGGRTSLAIRGLRGLISSLDGKSKTKLKEHYDKLIGYESNLLTLNSKTELETIFQEVLTYLHENYLKEAIYAKPLRPSKSRMGVPT